MRGSAFHQANATVKALTAEMLHICDQLVNSINSLSTVKSSTEIIPEQILPQKPPPTTTDHQMNATFGQQALIDAIQQLQQKIRNLEVLNRTHDTHNSSGRNGEGRVIFGHTVHALTPVQNVRTRKIGITTMPPLTKIWVVAQHTVVLVMNDGIG